MNEKSKLVIEALSDIVIRVANTKRPNQCDLDAAVKIGCKLIENYPSNLLP